jgi:asparagine synthase (glutamine-hydrolysing)
MCGIAGILAGRRGTTRVMGALADTLAHRGPDDRGTWADEEARIGLGHRRLAIVDLSPTGHQPMISNTGRFVLVFNGEIYNHRDLRRELEHAGKAPAEGWAGESDTEVFLHYIEQCGLRRALDGSVGMFAFAMWDRSKRTLSLVRDRFGEKPLYYGWVGGDFVFASELKALSSLPAFDNPVSAEAVETFVARTYIPAPLSIYQGIFKLPPGCILEVDSGAGDNFRTEPPQLGRHGRSIRLSRYWDYSAIVAHGLDHPIEDEESAVDELEMALAAAIRGQSVADVPVGVFLSGGLDSSTVAALYNKHSAVPLETFTIGFQEAGFDEAAHAKAVAGFLGARHHEHYLSVEDALGVIPLLPAMYDEPFADSSQIPTYLVSKFARERVTVALTGDGGDELLSGYSRYGQAQRLWNGIRRVPKPLRRAAGATLGQIPAGAWNGAAGLLRLAPHQRIGSRLHKAVKVGGSATSFEDVYTSLLCQWPFEQGPVLGPGAMVARPFDFGGEWPDAVRAMYGDAVAYLPDDILCKVDRAAMSVSLETRVPFLDHRVAEVAARIPLGMKRRGGRGKMVLRTLLGRELPKRLFERPKTGFALPLGDWLRGPLRDWAEDLLDPRLMAAQGWFDAVIVRDRWQQHLGGQRHSAEAIWAILMFQSWFRDVASPHRYGGSTQQRTYG